MALEGTQIGHYRLQKLIGSGGMGEVYLAEDTRIARKVAIKVVKNEAGPYPDAQEKQETGRLFQREMKAIATLDHPNILPLIDFGEQTSGNVTFSYMIMPFRTEGSLVDWLHQRGNESVLPPQDVVHIILQAASALQHAHSRQLKHLDVKPSNFLTRHRDDTPDHPDLLLADFGISKFDTATATASQSIRGTPTYMAPEQWSGSPVAATDQYALAVMAYQLLTGKAPFQGGMQQMMYQHLQGTPEPPSSRNSAIPATVDRVVLRALAKKPEERFPSIQAFASAFEQAWHVQNTSAEAQHSPTQYVQPVLPANSGNIAPLPPTHYATSPSSVPLNSAPFPQTQHVPSPVVSNAVPVMQPGMSSTSSKKSRTPRILAIAGVIVLLAVIVVISINLIPGHQAASNSGNVSGSSNYPQLKSSYSGTLLCQQGCTTTTQHLDMTSIAEDQQGNISGTRTLDGQDAHSFRGTVTTDDRIAFTVILGDGSMVNYTGQVYADGHLAGQWQINSNISGTWTVS